MFLLPLSQSAAKDKDEKECHHTPAILPEPPSFPFGATMNRTASLTSWWSLLQHWDILKESPVVSPANQDPAAPADLSLRVGWLPWAPLPQTSEGARNHFRGGDRSTWESWGLDCICLSSKALEAVWSHRGGGTMSMHVYSEVSPS